MRIWVEGSTVEIPLMDVVTRRTDRTAESSTASQALRSVITRRDLLSRIRLRFWGFWSSLEAEWMSSSARDCVVELFCVVDVVLEDVLDVRREERACDLR